MWRGRGSRKQINILELHSFQRENKNRDESTNASFTVIRVYPIRIEYFFMNVHQ